MRLTGEVEDNGRHRDAGRVVAGGVLHGELRGVSGRASLEDSG